MEAAHAGELSAPAASRGRFRATAKPGKIDHVVATLGRAIARGNHSVGSVLPSEVELEQKLDAGRGVIREAVKILAAKGLVTVGPRHGTRVCPMRSWNFLDRDVLAWAASGPMAPELLVALEEARRIVEPAAAALAAERATEPERAAIRAAYEEMVATQADAGAATEADKAFHIAILDATHNPVLGSFRSGLEAILDAVFAVAIPALAPNLPNHEAVLRSIDKGDPAGAREAMERLLDVTRGYLAGLPLWAEEAEA
jgi:GntR family galactonate operon transcriptional repressor